MARNHVHSSLRWALRARYVGLVMVALAGPLMVAVSCAAPPGYAALVRTVGPSVVTILVEQERVGAADRAAARAATRAAADVDPNSVNALVRRLLAMPSGDPGRDDGPGGSLGSGFVIREDGLIVTNRHVIVDAHIVKVRLADGREVPAKILGTDAITDIALLSVQAGHLPALRLGSTKAVSVGDVVIAIGNPYGLGQSVSSGIISARGRIIDDDPYIDFLQTDAAINRGNSGGPLMTTDGTVVGVTSQIFSPSGGSVGLGFAIPAETVAIIVKEIEQHGRVRRGYLGISAQPMNPTLATALHLKTSNGALVTAVEAQGPSDGALAIGDVLTTIESQPVAFKDLSKVSARLVPDSLATVTLFRNGAKVTVAVKVGRLPDPASDPSLTGDQDVWIPPLKLGVAETTAAIRHAIKADAETGGMIVTQLRPAGAGALAGLKVGDLLTHVGTKPIFSATDLISVKVPSKQEPLVLRVIRDGAPAFVALTGDPVP